MPPKVPVTPKVTPKTGGPNHPQEALSWIKQAIREGQFRRTKHLLDRVKDRTVAVDDVLFALLHGQRVEPYGDPPQHGGTSWRVFGPDRGHRRIAVGVEAYRTEDGRWAILCSVIMDEKRR